VGGAGNSNKIFRGKFLRKFQVKMQEKIKWKIFHKFPHLPKTLFNQIGKLFHGSSFLHNWLFAHFFHLSKFDVREMQLRNWVDYSGGGIFLGYLKLSFSVVFKENCKT
jgi:hypothetical protein